MYRSHAYVNYVLDANVLPYGGKPGEFTLFKHLGEKFVELIDQPKGY